MTTESKSKKSKSFRLKVNDGMNISFLFRENGRVTYCSGSELPLALANLAGNKACELRFALQDALDARDAANAVRKFAQPREVTIL